MEMEYVPPPRRGRITIVIGVILAVVAGGAAYVVVSSAQQQASVANTPRVSVVVAARVIPARKTIDPGDVVLHQVPADALPASGAITDPSLERRHLSHLRPRRTADHGEHVRGVHGERARGQSGPDETVAPDLPAWRAVSLNVPDDRALGGLLGAGQTVDIFVTVPVSIPAEATGNEKYVADRSTKVTYQDVPIIAKNTTFYVVRVTQQVAEEIAHLQASGSASFSLARGPTSIRGSRIPPALARPRTCSSSGTTSRCRRPIRTAHRRWSTPRRVRRRPCPTWRCPRPNPRPDAPVRPSLRTKRRGRCLSRWRVDAHRRTRSVSGSCGV